MVFCLQTPVLRKGEMGGTVLSPEQGCKQHLWIDTFMQAICCARGPHGLTCTVLQRRNCERYTGSEQSFWIGPVVRSRKQPWVDGEGRSKRNTASRRRSDSSPPSQLLADVKLEGLSELELAAELLCPEAPVSPSSQLWLSPVETCVYWRLPHYLAAVSSPVQLHMVWKSIPLHLLPIGCLVISKEFPFCPV